MFNPNKPEIRKEVDRILDQKDEKVRLQEAFELWLKVNPKIEVSYSDGSVETISARQAYKETLEKIKFLKSQHETSTGLKKEGTSVGENGARWRSLLEFPPGSLEFMEMFAVGLTSPDKDVQKKTSYKLAKVFPQFVTPERI